MAVETTEALDAKAHALIGQLAPQKLAAVVRLLEVMVDDEDDDDFLYTEENVRRFRESQAASSPGAECGAGTTQGSHKRGAPQRRHGKSPRRKIQ